MYARREANLDSNSRRYDIGSAKNLGKTKTHTQTLSCDITSSSVGRNIFKALEKKISSNNIGNGQKNNSRLKRRRKGASSKPDIRSSRSNTIITVYRNKNNFSNGSSESTLTLTTTNDSVGSFSSERNGPHNNVQNCLSKRSKHVRLFDKKGKPLTDRVGRPLVNILGECLVVFNDNGRVISDLKGNQVFNCKGESAFYSSTDLSITPSDNEPGIPLLDVDKKHIMFLYDNKGHPLTDSLGRPLTRASGKPMIGMREKERINVKEYEHYEMKTVYSRAPFENFVRRIQIFDSELKPLTDESGKLLSDRIVVCNENGMPMCDEKGRSLYFKYGERISRPGKANNVERSEIKAGGVVIQEDKDCKNVSEIKSKEKVNKERAILKSDPLIADKSTSDVHITYLYKNSEGSSDHWDDNIMAAKNELKLLNDEIELDEYCSSRKKENNNYSNGVLHNNVGKTDDIQQKALEKITTQIINVQKSNHCKYNERSDLNRSDYNADLKKKIKFEEKNNEESNMNKQHNNLHESTEAIVLFDASKSMDADKLSPVNTPFERNKNKQLKHNIFNRKVPRKRHISFIQYFCNKLNLSTSRPSNKLRHRCHEYNEHGKPLKDIYGNLLYDSHGIPLTGAQGKKLSEKARQSLRLKLKNIPIVPLPVCNEKTEYRTFDRCHDKFTEPYYDKYGRPLYDLFGKLIYDAYGRPLTDAYGRPLVDALGQPFMDCEGNVLTSVTESISNMRLTDIFGRKIYDKRGRELFDAYGRPKYDIFTNAIYDSCGRPATDANGNVLLDFVNKPIQPCPEVPLCPNARALLPKYIDVILTVPTLFRVLKYSQPPMTDIFGGPLFDDFGRPLYNSIGKPLYDKYGRPLYDKKGIPLCDCFGRPLSEEIRQDEDDQTLSVIDSLKLLKLTKESSDWMEIKRSKILKSYESDILNNALIMKVIQPDKKTSTQYIYALTRVTRFASGRQALEILEAPLSPSTAVEMHRLPLDNKPLIMVARHRRSLSIKHPFHRRR